MLLTPPFTPTPSSIISLICLPVVCSVVSLRPVYHHMLCLFDFSFYPCSISAPLFLSMFSLTVTWDFAVPLILLDSGFPTSSGKYEVYFVRACADIVSLLETCWPSILVLPRYPHSFLFSMYRKFGDNG